MSAKQKSVKAICIHPNKKYSLENIKLVSKELESKYFPIYYLEPDNNIFNCKECGRKAEDELNLVTRKFIKDHYNFNLYYSDVHSSHSTTEHHACTYSGCMYLLKNDSNKYTDKKRTADNVFECDTYVDCTEDDIQFIKLQIKSNLR